MQTSAAVQLTGRNLRLYFRDWWSVFFSLLGALVLLGLYTLFLGDLSTRGLEEQLPAAQGTDIRGFVDSWMFAGVVLISSVTTGLAALSTLVDDRITGRFRDFLVTPVNRGALVMGYLLSAVTVAVLISYFLILISFLYLGFSGAGWLPAGNLMKILAVTLLCCLSFGALSAYLATFLKSAGATSAFNATVGTTLGFVAAAYIPIGALPKGVANVINALPFAQAGMLLRQQFSTPSLDEVTAGNPQARAALEAEYGLTLEIGSWSVPNYFAVMYLGVLAVIFLILATLRIRTHLR